MTEAELKTLAEETAYELCEGPPHQDTYDAACAYCSLNYRVILAALQRVQRAMQVERDNARERLAVFAAALKPEGG